MRLLKRQWYEDVDEDDDDDDDGGGDEDNDDDDDDYDDVFAIIHKKAVISDNLFSVEGEGHCGHWPMSNWEPTTHYYNAQIIPRYIIYQGFPTCGPPSLQKWPWTI